MTQFHDGQEVEVWCFPDGEWEKAKIVHLSEPALKLRVSEPERYTVQFHDGSRGVFDADHIRRPTSTQLENDPSERRPRAASRSARNGA